MILDTNVMRYGFIEHIFAGVIQEIQRTTIDEIQKAFYENSRMTSDTL